MKQLLIILFMICLFDQTPLAAKDLKTVSLQGLKKISQIWIQFWNKNLLPLLQNFFNEQLIQKLEIKLTQKNYDLQIKDHQLIFKDVLQKTETVYPVISAVKLNKMTVSSLGVYYFKDSEKIISEESNSFVLKIMPHYYTYPSEIESEEIEALKKVKKVLEGNVLGMQLGAPKLYKFGVITLDHQNSNYYLIFEELFPDVKLKSSLKELSYNDHISREISVKMKNSYSVILDQMITIVYTAYQNKMVMRDPDFFINFESLIVKPIDCDLYFKEESSAFKRIFFSETIQKIMNMLIDIEKKEGLEPNLLLNYFKKVILQKLK